MLLRIACSSCLGLILLGVYSIDYWHRCDIYDPVKKAATADDTRLALKTTVPSEESQANHKLYLADLKQAQKNLRDIEDYEARFVRQIRKNDELLEPEEMSLKLRHKPFSVYLRWNETGKEALYVEGRNEGKLLVKLDQGLLSFAGTVALLPDENQAMQDSRYPITKIGLLFLVERMLQEHDKLNYDNVVYQRTEESLEDVACVCYTIVFPSPAIHPEYSKTQLYICSKSGIPIKIASYGWDDQQPGELIERYEYNDLKPNQHFNDRDFDRQNEAYNF